VTETNFRKLALSLNGAEERAHMGHPDFRVGGRIFATLRGDGRNAMVKLTPEEQSAFVGEHPEAFAPESGAWGRAGCTRVRLEAVSDETVGEALTLAWQAIRKKTTAGQERSPKKRGHHPPRSRSSGTRRRGRG
jgi:hypothetical protein